MQTQLSMVCHSICSKQTAARDYFRMSPSSDVSEVVKENERETDGVRITSCHSYMYSPQKNAAGKRTSISGTEVGDRAKARLPISV